MAADAFEIAAAVRSRGRTAVAVVSEALDRLSAVEGAINAFTVVLTEQAMAAAERADQLVASGRDLPPLLGVPISVKDHVWLAGAPATNGSAAYRDFVPTESCASVARLVAAGAIVVGKTNNPEFCYRGFTDNEVFGLTRNPWDLGRTPGGSSGGAGASVAAGVTPIAVGTDGGGSIRIPAAFCGVVGHKPTFGLVPKDPGFLGWKTLSVTGPITATVRDAALALATMAGASELDDMTWPVPLADPVAAVEAARPEQLAGLRLAYSADLGWAGVEPDVLEVFETALASLERAGARLTAAHPSTPDPAPLWNLVAGCEGFASEGPLLAEWEPAMSPGVADLVRLGEGVPAERYIRTYAEREALHHTWSGFFAEYDALLTPAMPLTAFPVGVAGPTSLGGRAVDPTFDDWCVLAYPANLVGLPATVVPAGLSRSRMPVGLQILGPRFADSRLLGIAAVWEAIAPWRDRHPAVYAG